MPNLKLSEGKTDVETPDDAALNCAVARLDAIGAPPWYFCEHWQLGKKLIAQLAKVCPAWVKLALKFVVKLGDAYAARCPK